MNVVLHGKNIAITLFVTCIITTCTHWSVNAGYVEVPSEEPISSSINKALLDCIPQELKNFSRKVGHNAGVSDDGYFIPLETGNYTFRVRGRSPNPFSNLKMYKEGTSVARNFLNDDQYWYTVQFKEVHLTKGQVVELRFAYISAVFFAIPVSFAFKDESTWTDIWSQLLKRHEGADILTHQFFGDWAPWTPCNSTCGELGKKTRQRVCAKKPLTLDIRLNYQTLSSFNESKSCLAKISCSGVLYTIAPSYSKCTDVCIKQNRNCAIEGHDLPKSSAIEIFETLGEVCQSTNNEYYEKSRRMIQITSEGMCMGYENIPDQFNCDHVESSQKLVCPCAPAPVQPTIISVDQVNITAINVSVNYSTANPRLQYYRSIDIRVKDIHGNILFTKNIGFSISAWTVLSGLRTCETYCLQTRSRYTDATGSFPRCYNFTIFGAPSSAPSNISVLGDKQTALGVSWNALDLGCLLTKYSVYVWNQGNLSTSVNTTGTNLSIGGLQMFTRYCVQVSAWTTFGEGPLSDCINGTTLQGVPLSAPRSFAIEYAWEDLVCLAWERILPDQNHDTLEGHRVYFIECDQSSLTPYQNTIYGPDRRHVNITDWIKPFTCFSFRMAGFTEAGEGPYTEWINTTTKELAPSAPPGQLDYQQLNNSLSVNITWQSIPSVHANGVILGYIICLWSSSNNTCSRAIATCPEILHRVFGNLTVGENYCYKISAFTAAGVGPLSACLDVNIEIAPDGFPQNISARNTSSTSINIEWGQVDTGLRNGIIRGYRIFWKELTANQGNSMTVNGSVYSLKVNMLKTFTTYFVQIQAYNSKGNGPVSPCVNVTTDEGVPLMAPPNFTIVSTTSSSITTSCSRIPTEYLNGYLLGYNIHITKCKESPRKEEAGIVPVKTTGTVAIVVQLAPYTCYSLSLSAFTRIGEGNITYWRNGTTLDEAPSDFPQGISAQNTSSTSFNITWNQILQNKQNGIILGYRIFYTGYSGERANLSKTINASTFSLEVTMLSKYSSYCVQVLGFNRKGDGPLSPCVNVTTDEALPSKAPVVSNISTTPKLQKVVWETLPEEYWHGVLLGYTIYRKKCSAIILGSIQSPHDAVQQSIRAKPNTCYLCQMCAYNRIGCGVRSEWKNCSTPEGVPDASPQGITSYGSGTTSINVTWGEVPASLQNGVILGYKIFWKESLSNGSETVNDDTFSLDIKGLKKYTLYCVQVLAFTKVGDGTISECIDVKTGEDIPNESPSSLIGRNLSSTALEINWEAPPINTHNGQLLGYAIAVYKFDKKIQMNNAPSKFTLTCPHNTSKEVKDLLTGRLYCVKVAAFNRLGIGNFSNCSIVKLKEKVPSRPPQNILIVDKTATSFRVTWTPINWSRRNGYTLGFKLTIRPYTTTSPPSTAATTNPPSTAATTNPPSTAATTTSPSRVTATTPAPITGAGKRRRRRRSVSSDMVITLGPDVRSYQVNNLDRNTEYCVQLLGFNSAGEGMQSDCLLSRTFATDTVIPQLSISSGSSSVRINLNISNFDNLVASGFLKYYEVQYKILSVSGIPVEEGVLKSRFFNATTQTITLDGLSQYTSYLFQATVVTKSGRGNFTYPVVIETCHCPSVFYTNWYVNPPFTTLKKNNQISGIIPSILDDVMKTACKYCDLNNGSAMIDYYNDEHGNRESMKNDVDAMRGNITSSAHISFPLSKRNKELKYQGTYTPLLYIPGLLIVSRNESSVERYARVVAGSVYDIWPILVINMILALLAGTIIWLLERGSNSEQFPVSTLKGIGEGAWWAFITMTTLGYGDRVPVTRAGRIFAIIWALVGISITSIMIGSLCSTLTITVVEEFGAGLGRGTTIGAVALTHDAEIADEVSRGRATVKYFPSIEELVKAQKSREVDNIIVDHFTAQSRKDLFNGTWYKISSVINQPYTYGVLLTGEATKLERYFKEYTAANVAKVIELANMVDKSGETNETMQESVQLVIQTETVNFLDPSSSIFGTTFLVLGLTLLFFFLCGLSYHLLVTNKRDKKNLELVDDYKERLETMRSHLQEFHSHCCALTSQLRTQHNLVLRQVLVHMRKQQSQKSADVSNVQRKSLVS